jgi:alkylated DNA repair dioxygenase AlkB
MGCYQRWVKRNLHVGGGATQEHARETREQNTSNIEPHESTRVAASRRESTRVDTSRHEPTYDPIPSSMPIYHPIPIIIPTNPRLRPNVTTLSPQDVTPDSAIINMYSAGDCIPPHIDHHDFIRPFSTISLLSEQPIVFGQVGTGSLQAPPPLIFDTRRGL